MWAPSQGLRASRAFSVFNALSLARDARPNVGIEFEINLSDVYV
jgi:hypothetical protein